MKLTDKKRHAFVLSDTAIGRLCWVDADGKLVRTMDGILPALIFVKTTGRAAGVCGFADNGHSFSVIRK